MCQLKAMFFQSFLKKESIHKTTNNSKVTRNKATE